MPAFPREFPKCAQCGSPMSLGTLLPTMRGNAEASFRCTDCGLSERVRVVATAAAR